MKHALIACCCLTTLPLPALEVHEWGTFTVLAGSNGYHVSWYSPYTETARLPDFVHPGLFGKGGNAKIRMETPVIYFYPKEPMKVAVEATFVEGSITETFPYSSGPITGFDRNSGMPIKPGKWTGSLHPPDDKNALSHIPPIKASKHSEPYGAAREVPDAWIFESDVKTIPGLKTQPRMPEMEKFIFYRGLGNGYLPVTTSMVGNQVTVTNQAKFGVALRVQGNKAAWAVIPSTSTPSKPNAESVINMPDDFHPLDQVESELAATWKSALAEDGLTPAEASAMVETWRKTWFREQGDRILTLVPRKTIDTMLPLKVTPEPTKTERVFVARIEMISPERELALAKLIQFEGTPSADQLSKFQELALDRFTDGAIQIAVERASSDMRQKLYHLKSAIQEKNAEVSQN